MKDKVMVIQQYFGLGDIIWGQTIANDFSKAGYRVIWPVKREWVDGLRSAYCGEHSPLFIDHTQMNIDYENKKYEEIGGILHLPMRFSESLMGKPYRFHMESKYSFLGKDWRTWRDGAAYKRNSAREVMLFNELGLKPGDKYSVVATTFGSDSIHSRSGIGSAHSGDTKVVWLTQIKNYSLFDWSYVFENASEIHAVSSSTLYLFELLDIKCDIHLYTRHPIEKDFKYVEFLFTKPYKLHV